MEERRKTERKHLTFFGRVFDHQTGDPLGTIADITTEGAMVISKEPFETGRFFQFRIDLQENIFGTKELVLEARSLWNKPDIDPSLFNTGFELCNVTPESAQIIEKIIAEYRIRGG